MHCMLFHATLQWFNQGIRIDLMKSTIELPWVKQRHRTHLNRQWRKIGSQIPWLARVQSLYWSQNCGQSESCVHSVKKAIIVEWYICFIYQLNFSRLVSTNTHTSTSQTTNWKLVYSTSISHVGSSAFKQRHEYACHICHILAMTLYSVSLLWGMQHSYKALKRTSPVSCTKEFDYTLNSNIT